MRSFRSLLARLRLEVLDPAHILCFVGAQHRHTALARYASIGAALEVLADEGKGSYPDKEALTRAFLAEFQTSHNPFWTTVLLSAYAPLLHRLRGRIYGDTAPREELDQLVLASFLEAAAAFPLDATTRYTALWLRQTTERAVFRHLRCIQEEQQRLRPLRVEGLPETAVWPPPRRDATRSHQEPDEVGEAIGWLVVHASAVLDGRAVAMLTVTQICGQRIPDYLGQIGPARTAAEHRQLYQRMKRWHSRLLARLRSTLMHLREPDASTEPLRIRKQRTGGHQAMHPQAPSPVLARVFHEIALALCGLHQAYGAPPELIEATAAALDTICHQHLDIEPPPPAGADGENPLHTLVAALARVAARPPRTAGSTDERSPSSKAQCGPQQLKHLA